jgi:hypothetical protein
MIKGPIQSEIIEDVQIDLINLMIKQYRKHLLYRKTDIGPIQIGDRYPACVSSEDLRPPEGPECEKRILKNPDNVSSMYAR